MKQELEKIVLDNPRPEEFTMTLRIIGSETELLVVCSDDLGQIR
jgi:hypothetical protein